MGKHSIEALELKRLVLGLFESATVLVAFKILRLPARLLGSRRMDANNHCRPVQCQILGIESASPVLEARTGTIAIIIFPDECESIATLGLRSKLHISYGCLEATVFLKALTLARRAFCRADSAMAFP
ncbi:hypothetical protein CC2G_001287 [Coprinopsis cinerea AmutBmut pab1-1]|nr:hypothetical protein CC2G_001287 [Coprinopsis cinerea AmutBmut pab1-1]